MAGNENNDQASFILVGKKRCVKLSRCGDRASENTLGGRGGHVSRDHHHIIRRWDACSNWNIVLFSFFQDINKTQVFF